MPIERGSKLYLYGRERKGKIGEDVRERVKKRDRKRSRETERQYEMARERER